jgi:hypothetical protein
MWRESGLLTSNFELRGRPATSVPSPWRTHSWFAHSFIMRHICGQKLLSYPLAFLLRRNQTIEISQFPAPALESQATIPSRESSVSPKYTSRYSDSPRALAHGSSTKVFAAINRAAATLDLIRSLTPCTFADLPRTEYPLPRDLKMRLTTKSNGDLKLNGRAEQIRFDKLLHRKENHDSTPRQTQSLIDGRQRAFAMNSKVVIALDLLGLAYLARLC